MKMASLNNTAGYNNKMIQNLSLIISLAIIWMGCLVESSAIGSRDTPDSDERLLSQRYNEAPEELEAFVQQLRLANPPIMLGLARPVDGQSVLPMEQDLIRKRTRFQRSTGYLTPPSNIQKLSEDEEMLKRVLPEMLAQARDKASERALLKLLINASLRTSLGNTVDLKNTNNAADWVAGLLPSSTRGPGELSMADLMGVDGQFDSQDLYGNGLGKRGSYKPCAFNPVSCGRIRSSHASSESG